MWQHVFLSTVVHFVPLPFISNAIFHLATLSHTLRNVPCHFMNAILQSKHSSSREPELHPLISSFFFFAEKRFFFYTINPNQFPLSPLNQAPLSTPLSPRSTLHPFPFRKQQASQRQQNMTKAQKFLCQGWTRQLNRRKRANCSTYTLCQVDDMNDWSQVWPVFLNAYVSLTLVLPQIVQWHLFLHYFHKLLKIIFICI